MSKTRQPPPRRYPPLFEKSVPILLGMILLAMVVLLIVAISVAMGWIG